MFAIQNVKTGKFMYGTDFRYGGPHHQRTSHNEMRTYSNLAQAKYDFIHRQCGKDYRIVVLKTVAVKRVIDFDTPVGYDYPKQGDYYEEGN